MQALLIFRILPGADQAKVFGTVKDESAHNWGLYAAGVFRQSWLFSDLSGAVAIVEVTSAEQAREIADSFPMAKAGLLEAEVIGLRPYVGIEELFAEPFTPYRLSAS